MITKKDYEADLRKFRDFCRKNPFLIGCYVYVLVDPIKSQSATSKTYYMIPYMGLPITKEL